MPYAIEIADKGYLSAAKDNPAVRKGINVMNGKLTNRAVAEAFGLDYHSVGETLDKLINKRSRG